MSYSWSSLLTTSLVPLGLGLVTTGTVTAAVAFRRGGFFRPGTEPLRQRLQRPAGVASGLLALAAGVVGCACRLTPTPGLWLALVLLVIGSVSGLTNLALAGPSSAAPAPSGLPAARQRVSFALLAVAGLILAGQYWGWLGSAGSAVSVSEDADRVAPQTIDMRWSTPGAGSDEQTDDFPPEIPGRRKVRR